MKILYINYLFDKKYSSAGAAVHVREFVSAARKSGVNIAVYDLNKFDGEEAAAQSRSRAWLKQKLSRYVSQLNAFISNIGYFRREWKIISAEKPDALLVRYNLLNFSAPLIAKIKKIPLVLEMNSPMALEDRRFNTRTWHLPLLPAWTEKLNLKLADRVFTVSGALKSYFVKQGIGEDKISVVPNGVDIDSFRPEVSGTRIREKFGLEDSVVLGFIGTFHYWHGVDCLEELAEELCRQYDQVRFLLVGDGPLRADLESSFEKKGLAGKVVFTGYVAHDEMPEHLAAMDIVLAPYPVMAFFYFSPLKLFEYMAAGKPVVASRVGQIDEMVEDGVSGLLYEAGDSQQLILKASRLIESAALRANIGKQAREFICRNHSWQVNAEKVLGLIRQSLNGKYASSELPDETWK